MSEVQAIAGKTSPRTDWHRPQSAADTSGRNPATTPDSQA
jgi:hypothetical protein